MVVYFIKMNQKFQMVNPHFPLFWYPMFQGAMGKKCNLNILDTKTFYESNNNFAVAKPLM